MISRPAISTMVIDSENAEKLWTAAAAMAAVAGVWIARLKGVTEWFKKAAAAVKLFVSFPAVMSARMDKQDAQLAFVKKEMTPNGGGSLRDLVVSTNRLALVANLRTSRIIADNAVAMYECDPVSGDCTMANAALCELFGISELEMLGKGWLKGIAYEERQNCLEAYLEAIKSDIPYGWRYTILNRRTHEKILAFTEMTVLRDAVGKPVLYQGKVERIINPL